MIPLRFDEETKARIIKEFADKLEKITNCDETIEIKQKISIEPTQKMRLVFSVKAYMQTLKLVMDSSDEIAWHGIVTRESDYEFRVHDLLVYPQEVTGATVTTDEEEYADWLTSFPDELFNCIRFQAHSHVNMAVSPSSTDLSQQDSIVKQLSGEDYYIFAIFNKRLEMNTWIYDFKTGMKYGQKDIEFIIENDDVMAGMKEIAEDAEDLVVKRKYNYPGAPAPKEKKKKKDEKKKPVAALPAYDYEDDYYRNYYTS